MASTKISLLPSASAVTANDRIPIVDHETLTTQQANASQVSTFVIGQITDLNINTVTANTITSNGGITGSSLVVNSLSIPKVNLNINSLTASHVSSDALSVAQISLNSLTASNVTSTTIGGTNVNSTRGNFSSLTGSFMTGSQATINFITSSVLRVNSFTDVLEVAAPANPAPGSGRLYPKSDGHYYYKNAAGIEFDLTLSSSGASVIGGSGATNKIAIFSDASNITFDNNIGYDGIRFDSRHAVFSSMTGSFMTGSQATINYITASSGLRNNGRTFLNNDSFISGNVQISGTIHQYSNFLLQLTGNYVLTANDSGKTLMINYGNQLTAAITVPTALPHGYGVSFVQQGSGTIRLDPINSNVKIFNRQGYTRSAGVYAMMSLIHLTGNIYISTGDMQ
jgi:hypothetical protein